MPPSASPRSANGAAAAGGFRHRLRFAIVDVVQGRTQLTDESQGGYRQGGIASNAPSAGPSAAHVDAAAALSPLMARVDVAVAALLALIGVTFTVAMPLLISSGGIETERDFGMLSPVLIPRLAFGTLTVLAIIALFAAAQRLRETPDRWRADEPGRLARAGMAAVIAVAYAASVPWLGYILGTMLMTAAMAFYLGLRNPLAFIPGVLLVPIVIRFVFERLLLISLPRSEIESVGLIEDALMRFLAQHLIS
jgi:hypothetical protein